MLVLKLLLLGIIIGVVLYAAQWRSATAQDKEAAHTLPNVSLFVYRDLNRNRLYDAHDQPLAGVVVELIKPDGRAVVRRSNVSGFVNFSNSLNSASADVNRTGTYSFRLAVPTGWIRVSGASSGQISFSAAPQSRPGIVADRIPEPIGLVPLRTISGRVAERQGIDSLTAVHEGSVRALSPSGQVRSSALSDAGVFSIVAEEAGTWVLEIEGGSPTAQRVAGRFHTTRQVLMGDDPVHIGTAVVNDGVLIDSHRRDTLNLDLLSTGDIRKMPSHHMGITWENLVVARSDYYGGEGYVNHAGIGRNVLYNSSGYPATITARDGFSFHGAYFGVAWLDGAGERLQIRAWRSDTLVATDEILLSAYGPVWFAADFKHITRLEMATSRYWQFVARGIVLGGAR